MAWFVLGLPPCTSSPEGEAESLRIDCSDATLSARLNSRDTRGKSSSHGRRMEYSHCSLSGMMSRLSEPITRTLRRISKDLGQSADISASQEDSPVRISPSQERVPDWKARALGYGARCEGSSAKWDRDTSSWRTPQCLLFEDSTESLETLPTSGIVSHGQLSELTIQALPTEENASGSGERRRHIPTPTVTDATSLGEGGRKITSEDNFRGVSLKRLVEKRPDKYWPANAECYTEDEIDE